MLTSENYYSDAANRKYLSVSQIHDFIGSIAVPGCEARALAKLNGEYREEPSDALLLGSLVDVMLTGTEEEYAAFVEQHPEMFSSRGKTAGQFLAKYALAETMVERARKDDFFMRTLSGDHQVIMTGKVFGEDFKCKIDSLLPNAIVDLKTTADIGKRFYDPIGKRSTNFIEAFDYVLQGAIYQEIVAQNTGKRLPFFISAIDKHADAPGIVVAQIDQQSMDARLEEVEPYISRIVALKNGEEAPERCGHCTYCRMTAKLTAPVSWLDIGGVTE